MLKEDIYIEDLILCLAGIATIGNKQEFPKLMGSDIQLIHSLGKQVIRNLGFTDRQNELAKRKVDDYKSYFSFITDLEYARNRNRIPIRELDRSRWIRIIENSKGDYEIAVRFTFQKKLISSIEELRRSINDKGTYDKETKVHSFEYSERTLFTIVNVFKDNHFELDDTVKEIYEKLNNMDPDEFIPGLYNYTIKNMHPNGEKAILEELGPPTKDNAILYKDRAFKYGLEHVDNIVDYDTQQLSFKIANRKYPNIRINSDLTKVDQLLLSIEELDRFPVLVLLPLDTCYDIIVEMQEYIQNLISSKDISVVFRLDNIGEGAHFNDYIKQHNLNNKLDINTKVVYCLDNKVPKPLVASNWEPRTILLHSAKPISGRKTLECFTDNDLIIHYQDGHLPVHYYYRKDIEDIVWVVVN